MMKTHLSFKPTHREHYHNRYRFIMTIIINHSVLYFQQVGLPHLLKLEKDEFLSRQCFKTPKDQQNINVCCNHKALSRRLDKSSSIIIPSRKFDNDVSDLNHRLCKLESNLKKLKQKLLKSKQMPNYKAIKKDKHGNRQPQLSKLIFFVSLFLVFISSSLRIIFLSFINSVKVFKKQL